MALLVGKSRLVYRARGLLGFSKKPPRAHGRFDSSGIGGGKPPTRNARLRHEHHATRDGEPVRHREVRQLLNRVAQSMPIVEQLAGARFLFVSNHHVALQLNAARNHLRQAHIARSARFKLGKQFLIENHAVFQNLSAAVNEEMPGERCEKRRVDKHGIGLEECAHEILSLGQVNRRFAADRRIDTGQKRGWYLYASNAAHVGGSREPRQVAHNAAAQSDDERGARKPRMSKGLLDLRIGLKRFRLLACLEHKARYDITCRFEARFRTREVERGNVAVAHNAAGVSPAQLATYLAKLVEREFIDKNIVAVRRGVDFDHAHRTPPSRASEYRPSALRLAIDPCSSKSCSSASSPRESASR